MPFYPDQPEGPGFVPVGHPTGLRMEPNALEPPPPPRTPSPLEMPDSDIKPPEEPSFLDRLGAGFRQENMVVGAARSLAQDHDYGPPDPNHNPLDFIQGTDAEQYWDRFLGSRNERETNAIIGRINQEIADRKLLADGGVAGMSAAMIASVVDLPTLLPGGVIYKAARTGRALSAAKSAASVGAAAGAATAVQEGFLHWQQYTRTLEESTYAVGGSIILGAILGAGISGVSSTALSRMARTLERDLKVPAQTVEDLFGEGGLREMERAARAPHAEPVGAASAGKPPVELKGALGAEKAFAFQDPVLRTLNSPFNAAREVGTNLFETVLGLSRNAQGVTTAPIGGAVETRIKMQQAELGQAIRDLNDQFSRYYFGKPGVVGKAVRSEFLEMLGQGGGKLTYKKFKEEVGKAMSAGDEHPIPEVAASAKRFRKLIDKHADDAIRYKLLDEEVVNAGRPSGKSSAKPKAQQAPEPPKTPDEALAEIGARVNEQAGLSPEQLDLRVRAGEMLDQLEKTLGQQGIIPQEIREQIIKGLVSDEPLYKELRDLLQRMADGAGMPGPDDLMAAIRAFHGSPHDFDRFSIDRMGTGEGTQVFGPGLYFAENPEVAVGYANIRRIRSYDPKSRVVLDGEELTVNPDAPSTKARIDAANKEIQALGYSPEAHIELRNIARSVLEKHGGETSTKTPLSQQLERKYRVYKNYYPNDFAKAGLSKEQQTSLDAAHYLENSRGNREAAISQLDAQIAKAQGELRKLTSIGSRRALREDIGRNTALANALRDGAEEKGTPWEEIISRLAEMEAKQPAAAELKKRLHAYENGQWEDDRFKSDWLRSDGWQELSAYQSLEDFERLHPGAAEEAADPKNRFEELGEAARGPGDVLIERGSATVDEAIAAAIRELRGMEASGRLTWESMMSETDAPKGVYKVDLDVEQEHLLDWDKPLNAQSAYVQKALQAARLHGSSQVLDRLFGWLRTSKREKGRFGLHGPGTVHDLLNSASDKAALRQTLLDAGIPGVRYFDGWSRKSENGNRNYVIFDDSKVKIVAKNGEPVSDAERADLLASLSSRRTIDALGFYSQALEAARQLPQEKGTPQQMLAMLKKAGVKDAEIEATGIGAFVADKPSVTKNDIVKFLEDNRISLREHIYSGDKTTYSRWSLDPKNPTYQETILHLGNDEVDALRGEIAQLSTFLESARVPSLWRALLGRSAPESQIKAAEKRYSEILRKLHEIVPEQFQSGHWSETNVTAHARTSIQKDSAGRDVFVVNELQSDWGQKLRKNDKLAGPGGRGRQMRVEILKSEVERLGSILRTHLAALLQHEPDLVAAMESGRIAAVLRSPLYTNKYGLADPQVLADAEFYDLTHAELRTGLSSASGHPLVNTTDQWVNTALRRMIRQAVEARADQIAIPSGATVQTFGMGGKASGIHYAYDTMYPKNLRALLRKIDPTVEPGKVDVLKSYWGGNVGKGFTTFPITDKVRQSVLDDGLPLFSMGGGRQSGPPPAGSLAEAHMMQAIGDEIRTMLPADVVARVERADFDIGNGNLANGLYDHANGLVRVSLSGGPEKALEIGRHEVIHALRRSNLFSDDEWAALVSHAKKTGVENEMRVQNPDTGEMVSTIPLYRAMYDRMLSGQGLRGADHQRAHGDFMDQELVAKMAESWEKGVSYGRFIDGLFDRARRMMEAVAKGLQKLGITTWDDWLERSQALRAQRDVLSGEVGSRGLKSGSVDPATGYQYAMSPETRAKLDELLGPEMVEKMFKDPSNIHPDIVRAAEILAQLEKRATAEVEKARVAPGGPDVPFTPKIANEVWDDKGQSYITRMYNRQKIAAQRAQFTRIITDYFESAQQRAAAVLSRLKNEIERGVAPDGDIAKDIEDLTTFTGLSRQDLEGSADKVVGHILGAPEGRLLYDLPQAVRGPLKARTLRIPDKMIEDYLERDIEAISRYYTRTMVPDIEMTRMFGSLDMKDQVAKIMDEAVALAKAAPDEKTATEFNRAAQIAVRDLTAVADRLRGTYKLPEDPMAWGPRIARTVRTYNYLRLLGGMTLASMSDPFRTFMTQGLVSTLRDGWLPLIRSLQTVKLAGEEVKLAGTALDMVLDTRAMAIADIMDDYGRYSKFERALHTAQEQYGLITLMAPWNAAWKQFTGMIVMTNIIRAAKRMQAGKATAKDIERLAASSIDEPHARLIADLFDRHGSIEKGVYLPNTQAWDIADPNVRNALEAFRGAVVRDVDRTIVTPGQDKPLWMSTEVGKIVGQVKSFSVSSIQRTLIAGLQERDAGVFAGAIMMIGMGAVSEALKNVANREKQPEGAIQWAQQAIDRSGLLGYLFDVNHFAERATAGQIGISKLTGKEVTRYAGRNWADAVLGPTAGLIKDAFDVTNAVSRRVFKGEQMAESDIRAMRRMLPTQNLFYMSWLWKEIEKGMVSALGARPARQR